MKYLKQMGIIGGISFAGELLHIALPFPVPASVYGLVLMTILLMTGLLRLGQVEETADYLIAIMPIFFVPSTVGLIVSFADIKGNVVKLLILCMLSTIGVAIVTGWTAQWLIHFSKKRKEKKAHE